MGIHIRRTPMLAVIGVLALGAVSVAAAQDTSGYQPSRTQTDTMHAGGNAARSDTSGHRYTGPPTDTVLMAKPGLQTGPTKRMASDTGMHHRRHRLTMSAVDTVVCTDGQNAPNKRGGGACSANGGVDTAATWAALKARGILPARPGHQMRHDTSSSKSSTDTSSSSTNRSSP